MQLSLSLPWLQRRMNKRGRLQKSPRNKQMRNWLRIQLLLRSRRSRRKLRRRLRKKLKRKSRRKSKRKLKRRSRKRSKKRSKKKSKRKSRRRSKRKQKNNQVKSELTQQEAKSHLDLNYSTRVSKRRKNQNQLELQLSKKKIIHLKYSHHLRRSKELLSSLRFRTQKMKRMTQTSSQLLTHILPL